MITTVILNNYRCFETTGDVPLKPLTVLIGQNDSGKSAFLDGLHAGVLGSMPRQVDWWQMRKPPSLVIQTPSARHKTVVLDAGAFGPHDPVSEMQPVETYRLASPGIPMGAAGIPETPGVEPQLSPNGNNLAAILDYVLRQDRKRFTEIEAALSKRVPGLLNVNLRTPSSARRDIEFQFDGNFVLPGEASSTGVRVILFFLTLVHLKSPPRLVLVEEPETGVHPKRLADIVSLLRDLTEGRYGGHAAQVVLSTHSPYLVDHVDLKKDQVLVFQTKPGARRTVEPANKERLASFLDEFMLGEIWFNRGEQGLVTKDAESGDET